ncbi:hypothetical protein JWG39_05345 [Desulforhopalus vacuolatus]|uniref:hypothetical protein n=1 Tax=Desulforhopalus vacuolatus TaxID=40414 RepID=UPI00196527F3|nr:hypothetical protein [Desulforhopalus vacuolatus]MBM9519245.1 hypothetical protein [Desulforhopalus vacuolatus]
MDLGKLWDTVSAWGQFPSGIFVGICLAHKAYSKAFGFMEKTIEQIREEKKELRQTIVAQQDRIDILHDEVRSTIAQQPEKERGGQ